jgi:ABC-type microcin C transport system permease subunit YejB
VIVAAVIVVAALIGIIVVVFRVTKKKRRRPKSQHMSEVELTNPDYDDRASHGSNDSKHASKDVTLEPETEFRGSLRVEEEKEEKEEQKKDAPSAVDDMSDIKEYMETVKDQLQPLVDDTETI